MQALGRHTMIEFWGCNRGINDSDAIERALLDAVEAVNATLIKTVVHRFSPYGVTGVAVLAESHMALHSWPEHGYLAADVFTCGDAATPEHAAAALQRHFQPTHIEVRTIDRGVPPSPE